MLNAICGVQQAAIRTAFRLQRAVTIQIVNALRLTVLTLLGRQVSELKAGLLCQGGTRILSLLRTRARTHRECVGLPARDA